MVIINNDYFIPKSTSNINKVANNDKKSKDSAEIAIVNIEIEKYSEKIRKYSELLSKDSDKIFKGNGQRL